MTTSLLNELAAHPQLLYRHTVEEYDRMIDHGLIEEGAPV